jgi:multisubunit Na+/H+ antiporter MnhE subunit
MALVELAAWWAACVGIWLVSLSAYSSQDLVVACLASLPCAAVAVAARRLVGGAWRPPGRETLLALAMLPCSIVVDAVRVLSMPWRPGGRSAGELRWVYLGRDRERPAHDAGRQAVLSLLMSVTPGSYVVHVDRRGRALVHAIGAPAPVERVVTK